MLKTNICLISKGILLHIGIWLEEKRPLKGRGPPQQGLLSKLEPGNVGLVDKPESQSKVPNPKELNQKRELEKMNDIAMYVDLSL